MATAPRHGDPSEASTLLGERPNLANINRPKTTQRSPDRGPAMRSVCRFEASGRRPSVPVGDAADGCAVLYEHRCHEPDSTPSSFPKAASLRPPSARSGERSHDKRRLLRTRRAVGGGICTKRSPILYKCPPGCSASAAVETGGFGAQLHEREHRVDGRRGGLGEAAELLHGPHQRVDFHRAALV